MWRQLVQPAGENRRGSLGEGGVAGVGGDGQVFVSVGEGGGRQGEAAGGERSFTYSAVTLRVSGVKCLRQTLRPGQFVSPAGAKENFIDSRDDI